MCFCQPRPVVARAYATNLGLLCCSPAMTWELEFRAPNYVIIFDNSGEAIGSILLSIDKPITVVLAESKRLRHLAFG